MLFCESVYETIQVNRSCDFQFSKISFGGAAGGASILREGAVAPPATGYATAEVV